MLKQRTLVRGRTHPRHRFPRAALWLAAGLAAALARWMALGIPSLVTYPTDREADQEGEPLAPLPTDAHLLRPVMRWAADEPDRAVAAVRQGDTFVDVTAGGFYARVRGMAKGLIASGLAEGDHVVLMSHTRLEWLLLDYAILAAGGVTVPVYEASSAEQLEWILSDSGADLAVVETPAMLRLYGAVHAHAVACRDALVIDDEGLEELADRGRPFADLVLLRSNAQAWGRRASALRWRRAGTRGSLHGTHRGSPALVAQGIERRFPNRLRPISRPARTLRMLA